MPLPESPPRRTSKGTIQRDYILKIKDPEGSEGGYPPDDDEESDEDDEEEDDGGEEEDGDDDLGQFSAPPAAVAYRGGMGGMGGGRGGAGGASGYGGGNAPAGYGGAPPGTSTVCRWEGEWIRLVAVRQMPAWCCHRM